MANLASFKPGLLVGVGLLICGAAAGVYLERQRSAKAETAMRAEVARLQAEVQTINGTNDHRLRALERRPSAHTVMGRGNEQHTSAPVASGEPPEPQPVAPDLARTMEELDFADQQASERAGDRLDTYLAGETVDAAWSPETTRGIQTTMASVEGHKLISADCRTRLCRVVVESDSSEEQRELPQKVAGNGPFKQDVFYRYDFESKPPKTTLYVARAKTSLGSLVRSVAQHQ